MNEKMLEALAGWAQLGGGVEFGGKYSEVKDELKAEVERRKQKLDAQSGEVHHDHDSEGKTV